MKKNAKKLYHFVIPLLNNPSWFNPSWHHTATHSLAPGGMRERI